MKERILVVGSSNTDMVVKTSRLPAPGETILGGQFFMNPGGKGANQAVAAARLGGDVTFVARVGDDIFGSRTRSLLEKEGIVCSLVFTDEKAPSGVALITVDDQGENCIVVAPGANNELKETDIEAALPAILAAEIILVQLETPLPVVISLARQAHTMGKRVILNPAPACKLPAELYRLLYLITPNETEAGLLTGIKVTDESSASRATEILNRSGVHAVIITMGSKGAYLYEGGRGKIIPAVKVQPVDTTAAGDVFNGALVVALARGMELEASVVFANKAAAISVTRLGAQSSAPFLHEMM